MKVSTNAQSDDWTVREFNTRVKIGFFSTIILMIKNTIKSWDLIMVIYKRDIVGQYKKSFVGMGWMFLSPILGILSWIFMNATGILQPGDVGIPYPAYILISTQLYGLFGTFIGAGSSTLGAGSGFINQVSYPHEALMVKQVLQSLTTFILNFVVTLIVLLIFGVTPHWMIVLLPVLVLPFLFFGLGIGLILCIFQVVFPDITKVFNAGIGFLMYITPVIYTPKIGGNLQIVIDWNPLTYILETLRGAIIYGQIEHPFIYGGIFLGSLIFFMICLRFFYLAEHWVIEKMI